MDPSNPDVLYAACLSAPPQSLGFQRRRPPGGGIYKTSDGGRTWTRLASGLPTGDKGRIGLALAASNPRVVHAIIEHATEGGIYRTEDAGARWTKVNTLNPRPDVLQPHLHRPEQRQTRVRPGHDVLQERRRRPDVPSHAARPDVRLRHQGRFSHHVDQPRQRNHFFIGSDGGMHETWDQGETFTKINNLPIGQFYAIGVDMREPYWIYGGMQDNHSWLGPSATRTWEGIINEEWKQIGFGDGMYHSIDPTNHRNVYTNAQNGELQRVDPETGDRLDIQPYPPPASPTIAGDWVTPSLVSRHDPNVVYFRRQPAVHFQGPRPDVGADGGPQPADQPRHAAHHGRPGLRAHAVAERRGASRSPRS